MRDVERTPGPSAAGTSRATALSPLLPGMRLGDFVRAKLHWLFLIYAVPAVVFLSMATAPFQVPDELNHVLRADQVARGKLVADGLGTVDGGWVALGALYDNMWFHPEVKQTVALARQAGSIGWLGPRDKVNFQNTVQYGPLLYAPQAIAIRLGQVAGLSVAQTLVAARLLNALLSCLLGFLALMICRRARALTFATLLLPMTLFELGSASQDALIIGLSLLTIAVASRILAEQRPAGTGEFALFGFVVMATTLARPSQIALALLLPAFMTWREPAWDRKVLIAIAAAAPIAYWMWLLRKLMPPVPEGWSVALQFKYLVANPLALPTVMANTFISNREWLWETVVGRLGWVDTPMPGWYYASATVILACALIAPGDRGPLVRPALLATVTFVGSLTAISFALYLSWNPVRHPTIHGWQGRYILPILPLLAWPIPTYGPRLERAFALAWYPVLLFPIVTLAVLPGVIMARYYGSWSVMAASLEALLLP